jgi:hypothetical protein
MKPGPFLADPTLAMCADVVDDLETVRIANQNRLRTLTAGDEYGHSLDADHPDVKRLAELVAVLEGAEHQAVLNLQRVMRKHPLGAFMKARRGLGEKQFARLLASLRDPYWNDLFNRPRTVRELYAYAGYHVLGSDTQGANDSQPSIGVAAASLGTSTQAGRGSQDAHGAGVAPTRKRGEKSNWNSTARKRLWLCADACIVKSSHYRHVYDDGRLKYADAIHQQPCAQCGPKGKPAQPGTPLSAGHQHARARRLIAKAILKDVWDESKRLHELAADQSVIDSQRNTVGGDQPPPPSSRASAKANLVGV